MICEAHFQAWITSARCDDEAIQAMVLALSLKQVGSKRKIWILISDQITRNIKYLFSQVFDGVVNISKEEINEIALKSLGFDLIVKIWCWKFTQNEKCVYLSPYHLAKEFCDDLFDDELLIFNGCNLADYELLVIKPNMTIFKKLVGGFQVIGNHENTVGGGNLNVQDYNSGLAAEVEIDYRFLDSKLGHFRAKPWLPSEIGLENTDKWLLTYRNTFLPFAKSQSDETVIKTVTKIVDQGSVDSVPNHLEEHFEPKYEGTIAIVGMSCRLPGANNAEEYWQILSEGKEVIRKFPDERPYRGPSKAREMQAGFLKCPIDEFDAKFFGISPREASLMDPQQRLLLEVTWECLENAGINPQILSDSDTGVFVGMWKHDYKQIIQEYRRNVEDKNDLSFLHPFLGNKLSAAASRISFCLGFHGPAVAVESGCSSALTALHLACESLHRRETSLALSSGVNLVLLPVNPFTGSSKITDADVILSKDYRCKTFDEAADGFVRAEACGVVALKRFGDASRDGDNILAVIKGSAINNDGFGTSFGTPNPKAQESVYRAALKRANVAPSGVSFLETHGTGTAVGDPLELHAVANVYSEGRTEPLLIGAVKTNIGHCESAAGIASLIKVILCMKHKAIPPNRNLKKLNPRINLASIPARFPMELTPWKAKLKIAAISAFSISATNAHVIIQEAPKLPMNFENAESNVELITLSATSEESLDELIRTYADFLKRNAGLSLKDVAYGVNVGRAHLQHRIAVVATNTGELVHNLETRSFTEGKSTTLETKIAFLFTGQGSQHLGMAQGLYEAFSVFRNEMTKCDALFRSNLQESLLNVIFENDILLNKTLYCQAAIFCVEYCLAQLWNFYGIKPDYVLGHSVGEFAAACCAGILTLEDAVKLVVERSRLINDLPGGCMLAIRADERQIHKLTEEFLGKFNAPDAWVDIAAVNSTEETIVSVSTVYIKQLEDFCTNNGIHSVRIPATHAFHSRAMDPILFDFGKIADSMTFQKSNCIYISGTNAKPMEAIEFGSDYWKGHLRDTVRFSDAVQIVLSECETIIEIGPQPILLSLAMTTTGRSTYNALFCPSLRRNEGAVTTFMTSLSKVYVSGVDLDWKSVYGIRQKCISLPTYPFQRQKYWAIDQSQKAVEVHTNSLHPLLGTEFLSPVSETIFYQTLQLSELNYLEDHKLADCIIFPAAAMLECFLAAGRHVLQGGARNKYPITVEHLEVHATLLIQQSCQIQTLVTTEINEELKYKLTLTQKQDGHFDKWKQHAIAQLTPSSKVSGETILDLDILKSSLTQLPSMSNAYKSIATSGIQFGPKFQSITACWYGPVEILSEISLPEEFEDYVCHPIVLDAMLQSYAFREYFTDTKNKQNILQLPISIRKFTWLSRSPTERVFAHCNTRTGTVKLYSENGRVLAIMEGLELIQTTVHSVMRGIREDSAGVPDFMCEKWRCVLGKADSRVDISKIVAPSNSSVRINEVLLSFDETVTSEQIKDISSWLNEIFFQSFCESIWNLNWPWPQVNGTLNIERWKAMLPKTVNPGILEIYFYELENRDYLEKIDELSYRVLRSLPMVSESQGQIIENITCLKSMQNTALETDINFAQRYHRCLPLVLKGKMTPLSYLFPEEGVSAGAVEFYTTGFNFAYQNSLILACLTEIIAQFPPSNDGILRILEIGAGSGSTTTQCLKVLKALNTPFRYTFTDISKQFLNEAKKRFGQREEMNYQVFNIENDPLAQGFAPEEFDIIIGVHVVHATVNMNESLASLKQVLRVGGFLILGESLALYPYITFAFGMLDGWWRFQDFRQQSSMTALLDEQQWTTCLEKAQFNDILILETYSFAGIIAARNIPMHNSACDSPLKVDSEKIVMINDGSEIWRNISESVRVQNREIILKTYSDDCNNLFVDAKLELIICFFTQDQSDDIQEAQTQLVTVLLNIMKSFERSADKCVTPKLIVVTRGVHSIGDSQPGNPNGATAWGMLKVFRNENPKFKICLIDLDPEPTPFESSQLLGQLWNQDEELFIAFRQDKTYAMRVSYMEKACVPILLPNTDRYGFVNPESGSIADIEIGIMSRDEPKQGEVELEVRACALNFRDLFLVMKPEGFNMPDEKNIGSMKSFGLDVSGVVVAVGPGVTRFKVGDEVFGFAENGALSTHALALESKLLKIPNQVTFEEASTITCAFLTAIVSLIEVANVTAADRVLIHVASGGVGLAAIQVVNSIGAEIYGTAGSHRKRSYLRSLGIKYVYNSRDTTYGEAIKRDTNGAGVTVVLNSLTGPNFKETTLKACSPGARFVEIGKVNIWQPHEVKVLRPDVKYTIVDLSLKDELIEELAGIKFNTADQMGRLEAYIRKGIYKGLPYVNFPLENIQEAFNHFQKAKHIGKIVVRIPKAIASASGKIEHKHRLFNAKSSYIITGGLGGIGLEVAKWMLSMGARTVVLLSRSLPTKAVERLIVSWNKIGSQVIVIQTDIGYIENCKHVLDCMNAMGLPPLRGVMHAAGVLSDASVNMQTLETFDTVFRPKVYGAWYFHQLTLNYQMEFFIMFSSISAILGIQRQCNHSAANRFLDSLAHTRFNMGLPGTSINWGGWSDVGAAAGIGKSTEVYNGLRIFTPAQGVAALERIMTSPFVQVAVSEIPDWNIIKSITSQGHLFDEMKVDNQPELKNEQNKTLAHEIKEASSIEQRLAKIQVYIEVVLKETLSLPKTDVLDIDQNFGDLGLDSLMGIEIKNRCQVLLDDKTLTLSAIQDYRTVRSLSKHICNLFENEAVENLKPLSEIIAEDLIFPADIYAPDVPAVIPSKCKNILLTGSTGHLGVYCLDQILKSRRAVTVYCLIRGNSEFEAERKLSKAFQGSGLCLSKEQEANIRIIPGDVSQEKLGLTEEMYAKLALKIDGIMHCAAKVDHAGPYSDGTVNDMRSHNVTGSLNVLRFASSHKTKFVQFASSMICSKADESGQDAESYPSNERIKTEVHWGWGYLLSKLVSEKLVSIAAERGIPITTIRYPLILGNSKTGQMTGGFNHYWELLLASIHVRMFPKDTLFGIPIIAVDSAAQIATHLFFNDEAEKGVYNLTPGSSLTEEIVIDMLKQDYGVVCAAVPLKEWRDVVFAEQKVASLVSPVRSFYRDEDLDTSVRVMLQLLGDLRKKGFSSKMIKNCPEISGFVEAPELLLRCHLRTYFTAKKLNSKPRRQSIGDI